MEEANKIKCYKRLIYKQFVQVSGFCGPQLLSNLPKRFTHLCTCRLYEDASTGAPIWLPEINKNIWSSLFLWNLFLFIRKLAYRRINISSNTWDGHTVERGETFFQRDRIFILVSRTVKTQKFKLLFFRNETCYGNGNLCKDFFLFIFNLV